MNINKHAIRSKLLDIRNKLSNAEKASMTNLVTKRFNQYFKPNRQYYLGGYYSYLNELDIYNILRFQYENNNQLICLPCILDNKKMIFRKWHFNEILIPHKKYKALEPSPNNLEVVPDIILTPLIGVDIQGNRLGYGKGYYDRYIQQLREKNNPIIIGLCYDFQIIGNIPYSTLDEKLDIVISDRRIIEISSQAKF